MKKLRLGVVGCGVISRIYMGNLAKSRWVEVIAVADLFIEKARELADQFGVAKVCTVEELLADPDVDMVVNLTVPKAHFDINMQALAAGKHVYCEKPLAMSFADAQKSLEFAQSKGLMLGCAPDTILSSPLQTCLKVIEEGWIGKPLAATTNFLCSGHELWHPTPEFFYKPGGCPMMDIGPYYVTAMVMLLGAVSKVSCFAKKSLPRRVVRSQPNAGQIIDVETYTHYSGIMEFRSGVIANINTSYDVWISSLPFLEIYGSAGVLIVPDPNFFQGEVKVFRGESMVDAIKGLPMEDALEKIHSPEMFDYFRTIPQPYNMDQGNLRGLGVVDMAKSLVEGRKHRMAAELACHVTEVLSAFGTSASEERVVRMVSTYDGMTRLPEGEGIFERLD
ncbi:MAG: Gfo/Idh/MocA family protein [Saccharofermentanales bacterium]|jgi:predicted dehydrogenase|nr:Gfo/Idh/MocA family oxidoreductase [Clostridiaceae bacterium]